MSARAQGRGRLLLDMEERAAILRMSKRARAELQARCYDAACHSDDGRHAFESRPDPFAVMRNSRACVPHRIFQRAIGDDEI